MPDAERGQVARVINSGRLVINRGAKHGVKPGWIYAVLRPENEVIVDPETNEVLGELELEKIRVRVVEVYDSMSVAAPFRKLLTGGGADIFGPQKEVPERIDVKDVPRVDKTVYTSDPVKLVDRG
ncbi:hypothetical protein [Mycobacterium sp. 94-17]|uniref:hypothetical protein n=1 Tax=Mycobacterium sp. 94-17 TaxID=2986147 RepID=UPI002D1ECB49|nr:hypothetical protein [Mycobacterium sp. 94-17]MEB4211305.1 hypothetical protein [Mycobacterium sp. 94-17]